MNLAAQGRKKGESRGRACYKKCPESSTANQTIFDCQISHQGREYRICYVSPTLPGLTSSEHLRSEEHTSELQSRVDLVCRLLLEKKNEKKFYLQWHSSNE